MTIEKKSPCKVNLLLNIICRRRDGFHELETIMHPVALYDTLQFSRIALGIELTCSEPALPTDSSNLVHRAAGAFRDKAGISEGVRIHLEKKLPMAAGLGGGSANAATTLTTLNELFDCPLKPAQLQELAASLGSDISFFLQAKPALATGRGEIIQPLDFFPALHRAAFILIQPGFGISTAWAYQQLGRFPDALNGEKGRAQSLINALRSGDLPRVGKQLYNSLEAPAFRKFPLLPIIQDFLREQGAMAALMSGSGSTTFAVAQDVSKARELEEKVKTQFGSLWTAVVPVEEA